MKDSIKRFDTRGMKEKIRIAEESVKDVEDKELKKSAFEVILNKLLSSESKQISYGGEIKDFPISEVLTNKPESKKGLIDKENFAKVTGSTVEKLCDIFDFDDEDIHILCEIPGKNDAEKQKNASLLYFTSAYYCKGVRECDIKTLNKKMSDLGIKSLGNVSTNLKNFENFFVQKGKKGSAATIYRITNPGLRRGVEFIKNTCKTS